MLKLYKYRIPFNTPFVVAGNKFSHREGVILVYKDRESGIEAYGEAAPLPGFSNESIEHVEEILKLNKEHLQETIKSGSGQETVQLLNQIHQFPSLSFGIDTLLYDLASKKSNKPLVEYLFPGFKGTIKCNGTLSIQEKSETLSKAQELINEGFHTLKVKVGRDFEKELAILKALRLQFPEIEIRIDANQAWTVKEAIANLQTLEPLNIEYCEQPVSKFDLMDLKQVTDSSIIPIAADESVRNKKSIEELSKAKAAKLVVLKPMLLGTFNDIFVTKEVADTHNIETIFTTSLESAVGQAATAAISAGLGNYNRAQGLATGTFLKQNVVSDSWLNKPEIRFPNTTGLGISLHLEGLKEF
ncbi:MAG: o-succinylbenzoate synthase [Gracilimonas sp.]|uniref:o-succinylbenzoate synthase n=1 Tax=Gracilimonas sp. TaxID=1974203 RepID=UPI0019AF96D8|nr:o-succinylbenzoate synthase [Gracilimonas sp.]MBD3615538.1 o-succinylbenzoate synthase [Gracilimonas sp.]